MDILAMFEGAGWRTADIIAAGIIITILIAAIWPWGGGGSDH